ncbi:NAD(P)H-binding protein [Paeniglutamicibacter psychrophenolicus]|uniref:Nucleoside-diphosphate-sugar epimerase n=1 Tax=Paeniglutamicibacter psychrophenolicus TaxID=257454 RepID=A0ABS4WFE0_9MICC|nr:NAD-dependent epimerase/dehydratase family protein [Paeniglutamicibacter psychrophenolicus]MBP2374289.1 nucleoside-diphosphate-sugar epimerase [Paeniglutamicibacter psychrophenolicus]
MKRAIILGGTGVLGLATAGHLLAAGWSVNVTGRHPAKLPAPLAAAGARFIASDRYDDHALADAIGPGAELLVDAACYTAAHATQLLTHLPRLDSTVMLSSKAVYVDASGNHVNSEVAPRFDAPIKETNPTMAPGHGTHQSREGYGSNKVAAEQVLLDSGAPVTVIRPSKVHGAGASNPREWVFLKRILDRRPALFLANAGRGADHTTAAANTAALIEVVAANPGTRILNSADPDAPTGLQIARTIAAHLGHHWDEILLDDDRAPCLGDHPWNFFPPIVLDTSASVALGYRPVGSYAQTVGAELDWLLADPAHRPADDDPRFTPFTDYAAEDEFLRVHPAIQATPEDRHRNPLP